MKRRGVRLFVEWTNVCNLKCNMCPLSQGYPRPLGHMSLELWSNILDCCNREGHFVDWANFYGEPLAWKAFREGMALWRSSGLSKLGHISTNGLLLTDDKIDCIAGSGIAYIRVCLDSMRPEAYKRLRGSDEHGELILKIEKFLKRAPKVHCQIQLMRSSINSDETPRDIFRRFSRWKNFSVAVSNCKNIGGDRSLSKRLDFIRDPRRCNQIEPENCPVTWDGQIGLCCIDYALLNRLGDMSRYSIDSVYLGEYAREVRANIRAGDFRQAPFCPDCPMGHLGEGYKFADYNFSFLFTKIYKSIQSPGMAMVKLENRLKRPFIRC